MASSGGDNAVLNVICSAEGVVLFQAPTRASVDDPSTAAIGAAARTSGDDAWSSNGNGHAVAPAVGMPLVKTFWFDHLDCDQRELQQILRKAGNGVADRVRVWVRVDEHQLIRAELTVTPLLDEAGKAQQILVRTEPTRPSPRARAGARDAEPSSKPVRTSLDAPASTAAPAAPPVDLLTLRMAVPMLRIEAGDGAVAAVNDAFADLLGKPASECVKLPLTEFARPAERQAIVEAIAAARGNVTADRSVEVHLATANAEIPARLSLVADPLSADALKPTLLVVVRDRSAERQAAELSARAADLAEMSAKSSESLRRFERFFERAPFGLALFENAQPLRTNAAFDAQTTESAGWVDALAHRALKARALAEQHSSKQSIASFWLGDDAAPGLVGTIITPAAQTAASFEQRHEATLRAMELAGRLAMIVIEPDGTLRPLGKTLDSIAPDALVDDTSDATPYTLVDSVFDADALGEYRSVTSQVRSSKAAVTTRLMLRDRKPVNATFVPFDNGGGAMLLLLEDVSEWSEQIEAARERVRAIQDELTEARATSVDPVEVERLRRQLAERRDQVRAVLDATGSGGFSWDLIDGTIHADQRTRELLQCASSGTLKPATLLAAAPADERSTFERMLFDAMSPDDAGRVDLRLHIGAARDPVRVVGHVVFEERDEAAESETGRDPTRFVAAVLDLRSDRRMQDELAQTQAQRDEFEALLRLRTAEVNAIFECAPSAIRLRSNGILRNNSVAAAMFGDAMSAMFEPTSGATLRVLENGSSDGSDDHELPVERAISEGEIGAATIEFVRPGESPLVLHSSAAPITLDGKVVGAVSIDADLTEQRRLEIGLRDREEQIAGFFQNTGVGLAYLDAKGSILDVNPQLSVLLGSNRDDLIGRSLGELSTTDDRSILAGQIEAVLSGELTSCSSEVRLTRRGGEICWTQLTVAPRHAAAGNGDRSVVAIVQDIDELRRLREQVGQSSAQIASLSERYELVSGTIAEGFVLIDAAGRLVEANDAARRLLGLRDAAGGASAFEHLQFESPETAAVISDRLPWQRALRGKATTAELRVRKRTGKDEVDAKSLVIQFAASPAPHRMVVVNVRDITARHGLHEDLQHAYARIVEAHTMLQQRTKALEGNFVSAVQQLGAAVGASAPLARAMFADTRLSAETRESARQLVDALRVHDRLVQHFVADTAAEGAAVTTPVRTIADVHALIDDATRLVGERFHVANRITRTLSATRATCRVDAALVRHALFSVLAHAASQAAKEPAKLETSSLAATGTSGRLRISVSWPGNRSNTAELTLARALVESERGTFAVAVEDGRCTATIEFELADEPLEPAQPPADARTMRVLLVEDHESTARVLQRQLTRLRCEVTPARSLAEARAALEAKDGPGFDLIVCDLTMPDGNAHEFVRRAASQQKVPTIGLRSYGNGLAAGDEATPSKSVAGLLEQLVKPVDLNALAAAIARITGRGASGNGKSK